MPLRDGHVPTDPFESLTISRPDEHTGAQADVAEHGA
jgi:hypothetical protein